MPITKVLVAAVSTRAMAESAARAGFDVTAVDAFGDCDQHPSVRSLSLPRDFGVAFSASAVARAAGGLGCSAIAFGAPFENRAGAVTALARTRELWGNGPPVLGAVRDPFTMTAALRARGCAVPECFRSAADRRDPSYALLRKPFASGGGHGVRRWADGERLPRGSYLQQAIDGVPASITFVAADGKAVPLSISRQIIGDSAFGASGYRYSGSILCPRGDAYGFNDVVEARLADSAAAAAAAFGLKGANGIDVVIAGDTPFVVEINPRWCASMELAERAGHFVFAAHVEACTSGTLPRGFAGQGAAWPAIGKAIVFARRAVTLGDTSAWLDDVDIRDVPHPGEHIPSGRPVCTVFASAEDGEACYAALTDRARRIYDELEGT